MPTFARDADGRLLDYYDLLGLSQTAPVSCINSAYRRVALLHHPDKNGGSPQSVKNSTVINVARDTLVDEELRAQYKAKLVQEAKIRPPKKQEDKAKTQKQRDTQAPSSNASTESYRRSAAPEPRARDPPNRYYAASFGSHNGQPEPSYGPAET